MRYSTLACVLFFEATSSAFAYINAGFSNPRDYKEYERLLRYDRAAAEQFRKKCEQEDRRRFGGGVLPQEKPKAMLSTQEKLKELDVAIGFNSKNVEMRLRRGRLLWSYYGQETGMADFVAAVEADPKSAVAHAHLALAHARGIGKLRDEDKALHHAKIASELDRERHAAIAEVLAFVHALRGDFTKAVVVQSGAEKLKGADTCTTKCLSAYRLKFSPMLADVVYFDRLSDAK